MEVYQSGMLAVSLAGHDKGKMYVVLGCEEGRYLLADGEHKLLSSPKRKNQKHVQPIRQIPRTLLADMAGIKDDADIRRILRSYRNAKDQKEESCCS